MRVLTNALVVSSLVAATACGGKDKNADLTYQAVPTPATGTVSPAEMGLDSQSAKSQALATTPVHHTTSTRRVVHHSTQHYYSSASAPSRTVTVKHTKRDAAIGAGAGAAVGGLASHSVKGAVIGGVVGAVLGGVVGNNVDVKKKTVTNE